jgi:hypothetical protein
MLALAFFRNVFRKKKQAYPTNLKDGEFLNQLSDHQFVKRTLELVHELRRTH